MSPLPLEFGDPVVTMGPSIFMQQPPDGWYMGQKVPAGPLYSRYTEGVPASVPGDSLSPAPISLAGQLLRGRQEVNVIDAGEVFISLEFIRPLLNEKVQEFIGQKGVSGSGFELFETSFDPISPGMYKVFASSTFGAPGGDAVVQNPEQFGSRKVTVDDPANFAVGQWVLITNTVGGERAQQKILRIEGNDIIFESDVTIFVEGGTATIKTVQDQTELTEGPDYSIDINTGEITVTDNVNTVNKLISVEYTTVLQDYGGADFWIIPGIHPITGVNDDYIEPQQIPLIGSAEQVGTTGPGDTSFEFSKSGNCLGRDYTLYIVALDQEAIPNPSLARAIPFTFIPARPTTEITEVGDGRVTVRWNDVTADGSKVDGYDVVRSPGSTFNPANAQKINELPITSTEFTDQEGASNRISSLVVPPPTNGNTFSYAIESFVTTNLWSILTRNQKLGLTSIVEASKGLSD